MFLSEDLKKEIKTTLDNGGVIAYVTDTVWGLGCLPNNEKSVKKIYEIKTREAQKPLILMSNEIENLRPYVKEINSKAQELIEKFFPGALTLILPRSEKTPKYVTSGFDTVGIRVPNNDVFKEICEVVTGHVLATTSANLSHQPSAKSYEQALSNMGDKVDMVIQDFGKTCDGLESTVALVLPEELKILRQGAINL